MQLSPSTRSSGTREKNEASTRDVMVVPSAGRGLRKRDSSQDTGVRQGKYGSSSTGK